MALDDALLVHVLPGRVRVKVPARHRDTAFFDAVAGRLRECDGVIDVRASPLTDSVLIFHATNIEAIAEYAARHGLFSVRTDRAAFGLQPRVPTHVPSFFLRRSTEGERSERERSDNRARKLSASMATLGVWQSARGQIMAPAVTLFWYAYDAWRSRPSTRMSAPQTSDEKP
jgi:hypothetical protein